jgi:hypothetical protein
VIADPDRAICGFATVFGVRSPNDGRVWKPDRFRDFLALETAIPLRFNHGPLITPRGAILGMVRRFATVTYPTHGLLVLAKVDDDAANFGNELLADLAAVTSMTYLPPAWHLSIAARVADDAALPYEISVTQSPAHEDAKILAVGEDALSTWTLLTERIVADRW